MNREDLKLMLQVCIPADYAMVHGKDCYKILEEFDRLQKENEDLKLKLTGKLQNKDGRYGPVLIKLSYLQALESVFDKYMVIHKLLTNHPTDVKDLKKEGD